MLPTVVTIADPEDCKREKLEQQRFERRKYPHRREARKMSERCDAEEAGFL
jgi:hypothetical protein